MKIEPGRPVCVLSIGRSGTSLATRVVNLLGIDLGPEETMLQSVKANPLGAWEQSEIVDLNGDILGALGGSFMYPPRRDPGWESTPAMAPFRQRVEELVARNFGGRGRWGFKSPFTTLTLPLWRSVVGDFDYIVCVRNPLAVRASAQAGVPGSYDSLSLWLHYNCEALRYSAGRRRMFVFYEDWFSDPMAVAEDLASFLHGAPDAVDDATWRRVASTFDEQRRTHVVSDLDLAEDESIDIETRALHFLIRDLAVAEKRGDDERAHALQALAATMDSRWKREQWGEATPRQASPATPS